MWSVRRIPSAWRAVDHLAIDLVLAVLLLLLMAGELAAKTPDPGAGATTWIAFGGAALITLPIAVHRRHPVAVVLVTAVAVVGYGFGHFVAFPGYASFALVFVVSLHVGRGRGAVAFVAMAVALGIALSRQPAATVTSSTWVSTLLALAVAWLAGENLRSRQARLEALQERARRLEGEREERARQAVAEERLRIARELHDVVAHSMSVIAVQAGVANHVIDSRPELAREALITVEANTRAALVEMRRLLGVLRQADEPTASLAPSPGLAEVDRLVAQLAAAGLEVRVHTEGTAAGVPDGVDLSAFRIVQEALTNVLRHGGPRARVRIEHRPGAVHLTVGDDGRAAAHPGPPEHVSAGHRPGIREAPGHGLLGMRERVAVFGGTFTAGPRPGGGFDVAATLPFDPVPPVPASPGSEPAGPVPAGPVVPGPAPAGLVSVRSRNADDGVVRS